MRKLKLYLDTSVINFLFADDAPELQKITIAFFNNFVQENKYDVYISEITNLEISRTTDTKKKDDLYSIIKKEKKILLINEEENYHHFFRMVTPLEVMYEE